jgi:hypothetical protein
LTSNVNSTLLLEIVDLSIIILLFLNTGFTLDFLLGVDVIYKTDLPIGFAIDGIMILTSSDHFSRFRERVDWSPANKDITILAGIWLGYCILQLLNPEARMIEPWIAGRGVGFTFLCYSYFHAYQ